MTQKLKYFESYLNRWNKQHKSEHSVYEHLNQIKVLISEEILREKQKYNLSKPSTRYNFDNVKEIDDHTKIIYSKLNDSNIEYSFRTINKFVEIITSNYGYDDDNVHKKDYNILGDTVIVVTNGKSDLYIIDLLYFSKYGSQWESFNKLKRSIDGGELNPRKQILEQLIDRLKGSSGLTDAFFEVVSQAAVDRGLAEDELVIDVLNLWASGEHEGRGVGLPITPADNKNEMKQIKLSVPSHIDEQVVAFAKTSKRNVTGFLSDCFMLWSIGRIKIDAELISNLPRGRGAHGPKPKTRRPSIPVNVLDKIGVEASRLETSSASIMRAIISTRIGMLQKPRSAVPAPCLND